MAEELNEDLRLKQQTPSRIERVQESVFEQEDTSEHHRPSKFNFMCMITVALFFDILGLFLSEIPFVGFGLVFISDLIFIPWFYFSGMKFNSKRVATMGFGTIAESIPIIGNMPLITANVFASYYLN